MRVFFDNCTTPVWADVLDGLVRSERGSARHIRFMEGYELAGDTPDVVWIDRLGRDRPADWVVITGDQRIRKNTSERLAWRRSGLKGFVLASAYQKTPIHQCASILLWRWPEMERFVASAAPGSMFELPINRHSGFVPLAV